MLIINLLFFWPGEIILRLDYYFPFVGGRNDWAGTQRRYRQGGFAMRFVLSIFWWLIVVFYAGVLYG